jgi:hypothetical protein
MVTPITPHSPLAKIKDISTFMGLVFCLLHNVTYYETPYGCGLSFNHEQLYSHLDEIRGKAIELATTAGLPVERIIKRDASIIASIDSFFKAGERLYRTKLNNRLR